MKIESNGSRLLLLITFLMLSKLVLGISDYSQLISSEAQEQKTAKYAIQDLSNIN
jgi:hypothetical protein